MKQQKLYFYILLFLGILNGSCEKEKEKEEKLPAPVPVTTIVSEVTPVTAVSGGEIIPMEGATVISRGVVWSTHATPTINDNKTHDGTGDGQFISIITGLQPTTTYYLRAYATTSESTQYGNTMFFTTLKGNTFTDPRDGNIYNTVIIDNQEWMTQNLKYLPEVSAPSSVSSSNPIYYVYGYTGSNVSEAREMEHYKLYGVLYNWKAAMAGALSSNTNPSQVQGVCPQGWHLPSDAEWSQLEAYLMNNGYTLLGQGPEHLGYALTSSSNWNKSSKHGVVGNNKYPAYRNKSGFSAIPGGYLDMWGEFVGEGFTALWWTTTTISPGGIHYSWFRSISSEGSGINRHYGGRWERGHSVRCLKD